MVKLLSHLIPPQIFDGSPYNLVQTLMNPNDLRCQLLLSLKLIHLQPVPCTQSYHTTLQSSVTWLCNAGGCWQTLLMLFVNKWALNHGSCSQSISSPDIKVYQSVSQHHHSTAFSSIHEFKVTLKNFRQPGGKNCAPRREIDSNVYLLWSSMLANDEYTFKLNIQGLSSFGSFDFSCCVS